ncbi:MAG TPA: DM13 domain-containing protein [Burkholderiales bacterium]
MNAGRVVVLALSHLAAAGAGFAAGVYALPILVAPPAPSDAQASAAASGALYRAQFRRDLKGSDFLHWGEGAVAISREGVAFSGRLAPGPDYKLYFAPEFVDTRDAFLRLKARAVRAGDIRTFDNFIVPLPPSLDVEAFNTVVVWCERFSMFITAAQYR